MNETRSRSFQKTSPPARSATAASYCLAVVLCLFLAAPQMARANPPERMTYQGFLVDGNGNALGLAAPKNYDVIFRLYSSQSGGVLKWAEQQTVTVDKGYFSVLLGEGADVSSQPRPDLSSVFVGADAAERFMETTVKGIGAGGSDATILPRLRLLSSPYAFLARNAVNAGSLQNSTNGQVVTVDGPNVGINQANPTSALDVNGTIKATTVNATTVNATTVNATSGMGIIPLGGIIMWSGVTLPTGWALCDGQNGTPNLTDRFVRGTTLANVNTTGGADSHTHTSPPHLHSVDPPSATIPASSTAAANKTTVNGFNPGTDVASTTHTHSLNIAAFNSASTNAVIEAASNIPAYYALAFIMRVQ